MNEEFKELILELKICGQTLISANYDENDMKTTMKFVEQIDHEIWLIKMRLYRLGK